MASTTLNENITIKGLDDINVTETFDIKPLEIKPIDITNRNELTVTRPIELSLKSDSKSDSKADIKSDSKSDSNSKLDLAIEPLKIDQDQRTLLDVKPLVIDTCQTSTTKLAPLPPTAIDQPYNHHVGITFMGMEMWGVTLSGRSGTVIESPPRRHSLVTVHAPHKEPCSEHEPCAESPRRGLKVRIDEPSRRNR